MRFDEIELQSVALAGEVSPPQPVSYSLDAAPRHRRIFALLIDLSLFLALVLALLPLLPASRDWWAIAALAGFVVMTSYYYFVGSWLLWGKTVGGTIFDVRVLPEGGGAMSVKSASMRWVGLYVSLMMGGLGFVTALFPSRRSLPDRMSGTRCAAAL